MNPAIIKIQGRLSQALRPKERLNIWQWADRYRFIAKGVSAKSRHGHTLYRSSDAPHQREPQEAFTDPDVQMVVLVMASQIGGKTEIFNNVLGYHMHYRPTNSVVMYPTIDSAEKYSKKKFAPMAQATPVLDGILSPARSRTSANTILVKDFIGGSIFFVGANSPASLRQASGEVLLADEIDSYEADAGGEGDPVDLLWKRGESYPDCVKGLASTPTIRGMSRIWSWYEISDQRHWLVPCAKCSALLALKWEMVQWPKGRPEDARLVCPKCEYPMTDEERHAAYFKGRWESSAPFAGIRGYHLNWLYCPWPAQKGFNGRLHQFAVEWLRAEAKGRENIKVLINTGLCECWEEEMEKAPDSDALFLRGEDWDSFIPEPVVFLTCAVDVQNDRLEYEILGWAVGEETYGIETGKLFGNPHTSGVWAQLDTLLQKTFDHPSGARLRISCCLIDSGGQTDNRAFSMPVYRFARTRQGRWVFACKGSGEIGAPMTIGRLQKNRVMLQHVGTDIAKSTVYERLEVLTPGPHYCHFPRGRGYDEEYFKQLTAERVSMSKSRGATKRVWIKTRTRNEALDLRVYNLAAFEIRNPNLQAISDNLRKSAKVQPQEPEQDKTLAGSHSGRQNPIQAANATAPRPNRRHSSFVSWK